jgi:Flp pilus assembly protein protease CpaA
MAYACLITLILTLISSIIIYKKCKPIEKSEDSVLPLYELLISTYKLPSILIYAIPNMLLMGLMLYFRFYKIELSADAIYELIKVFAISQIGFYLISVDLKTFIIPNKITFPTIISLFIYSLLPPFFDWKSIVCAIIAFAIIFLLQIVNPKGIGGGDAKLCAILGFMMGFFMESIYFVLFGFILGGLFNLVFMKMKLINRKDFVHYGIYFYLGACLLYTFRNFIFIV